MNATLLESGDNNRSCAPKQSSDVQAGNSAMLLTQAFSEFIATSSRLEDSYRQLQKEVAALGMELAERNLALKASVNENELMRLSLQAIVDSMPCGILVFNDEGKICTINPECKRLLNINASAPKQRVPVTLKEIEKQSGIQLALATEMDGDVERELCLWSETSERWLHLRHSRTIPRFEENDGPNQIILIVRDITAQKHAERDREAGRNAMALAEITTTLAHEIRNPLASLELFAELIEEDSERRGEWISNLRAGIRLLAGTVNNVLAFHTSSALQLSPLNLCRLADSAVQFMQPLADQVRVSLKRVDATREERAVLGNEGALQQVMLNLICNALRYTPAGGLVTLSIKDCGGKVVLECVDTGCGLCGDQISKIFTPGFSGNGSTPGLGLTVCERIMKQHGGSIRAAKGEAVGARFVLEFPCCGKDGSTHV